MARITYLEISNYITLIKSFEEERGNYDFGFESIHDLITYLNERGGQYFEDGTWDSEYFTKEDCLWFKKLQNKDGVYNVKIDNDCVWIVEEFEDESTCEVYTFSSYGYEFIHGVLNNLGIKAEFC